jgi:hypothetical protein
MKSLNALHYATRFNISLTVFFTLLLTLLLVECGGGGGGISSIGTFTAEPTPPTGSPTVSSTSPANGAIGIALNSTITATFSEPMDASTVTTSTFTLNNVVTGTVWYSGTTATFTPVAPSSYLAYSTSYTATITTGVKDMAGNAMAAPYTWTFTTGRYNVFAADTEQEAQFLATSMQQAFVNLRSGHPKRLPPPVEGYLDSIAPHQRDLLDEVLSCAAIGSHDTVKRLLKDFIEQTGTDELMITSQIFDHNARLRSYEITADLRVALD